MIGYKLKYYDPYNDDKIYTVIESNAGGIILQSKHILKSVSFSDIRNYFVIEDHDGEIKVPEKSYVQKFENNPTGEPIYITPEQYKKKPKTLIPPQPRIMRF